MWNITKTFLGPGEQSEAAVIKIDPQWGFAEFPAFGDSKKHILPHLTDPDEEAQEIKPQTEEEDEEEKLNDKRLKEFWMPDKYCKVCYGCEESFTMFRRRHHCRLCGQVFCNNCSSNFIEGSVLNMTGSIRVCRPCYDQSMDKTEKELTKSTKRGKSDKNATPAGDLPRVLPAAKVPAKGISLSTEVVSKEQTKSLQNLQNRASTHLFGIIDRLVNSSEINSNLDEWKQSIFNLVREVVSSVDPDVKAGDSIDIRPYVKVKVIPGGMMSECIYIDGVVFRKNVAHKKMLMGGSKINPRILLLASGIEFQRTDMKLSSMDTLIEQEDKFMEILVQKLMALKPDIILVGKAVARRAQELLCEHNVTVMQNVKQSLLERIARMTGATLLASTDNVVQQYGEECLGTCGQFWLRLVQDDPEKDSSIQPRRVLRTRISRGSTYVYVQGCPSERGCTIVLRGATRHVLAQVKHILNFAMVVAYHLRLEVAYYCDRCADLPVTCDTTDYDDSSDLDDEILDEGTVSAPKLQDPTSVLHEFLGGIPLAKKRSERQLLSTSLDVDFNVPYSREIIGTQLFRTKHLAKFQVESHQTLLINSLLIGEGTNFPQQKSPSDLKGIKYYTKHDIAFGQFIIDNCFQLSRGGNREPRMLDQTLTFVHRPGRIDITVKKADKPVSVHDEAYYLTRDPNHASLYISSYCKECCKVVLPPKPLSDEAWKMSFGKFLEMSFYNRSARCHQAGCNHNLRDSHVLSLLCESYVAIFEFVPIHAYTLHVRDGMSFPEELYYNQTLSLLAQLPIKHLTLMEDFRLAMHVLEKEIKEILAGRPEDLALAMGDVQMMEAELTYLTVSFLEDLLKTYECLPRKYADEDNENRVRLLLADKLAKNPHAADSVSDTVIEGNTGFNSPLGLEDDVDFKRDHRETIMTRTSIAEDFLAEMPERELVQDVDPIMSGHFPAALMRNTYLRALRWNTRIDTIYRFLESVRKMVLEQQQQLPNNPLSLVAPATLVSSSANTPLGEDAVEAEPAKSGDVSPAVEVAKRDEPVANPVRSPADLLSPSNSVKDSEYAHAHPLPSGESTSASVLAQPAGMNSLYRSAIEQNRRTAEKPVDKMTRITKALSRFLVGNKDSIDDQQKFVVPLGDFGSARLGLKPGRNGEVVSVSEDVLPSLIAYALTTNDYYDGLQASLHANNVDQTDFEGAHDDASEKQSVAGSDKRDGGASDQPMSTGSDSGRTLSLPFKKKKPVSQTVKQDANNLSPIPEENMEEHDLDNEDGEQGTIPKTTSYGMMKNLMDGFSNTEDSANPSNNDVSSFGGMFEYSKNNDDNGEQAATMPTSPRTPRPQAAPSTPGNSDKGSGANTDASAAHAPLSMDAAHDGDSPPRTNTKEGAFEDMSANERQMISQDKSNIRVRFDDYDDEGNMLCKFQCQIYWAKQFEAVRNCYFKEEENRENFIRSLAMTNRWVAQGGKSGASFAKTLDERLVIKVISRVELQMFLDFAPAYFEYMAKAYYHNLPTVLCKILGMYTVRYDNKETGKKSSENVVVMENIFYQRNITRTFDLKGSSRARYVELVGTKLDSVDDLVTKRRRARRHLKFRTSTVDGDGSSRDSNMFTQPEAEHLRSTLDHIQRIPQVLLDDNFMEQTRGRPFPLKHRAKMFFHKAVQNDTLFLSIVNVVDYSILVGFDDKTHEVTVGIIDYLRQYDIIKKMERVGKGSVGMLTGQAEPTIIQPSQYRKRFSAAMERYFMTVPDKWISYDT